ncbi:MAG TPA: hypothetical protein VGH38_27970, partial [Bryobacteraceae bacterium]
NGAIDVYASRNTDLVIDINGYFTPPGNHTLQFYPLTPCRVLDTRNSVGTFGGPFLAGATRRAFPIASSPCLASSSARAYALYVTAVPRGHAGYLTAGPAGQSQPNAILNSLDLNISTVATIVPAGMDGGVNFFASEDTDLIVDVDGYFASPGTGLNFYTLTPCRIADTRDPIGIWGGPILSAGKTRSFPLPQSSCGLPASASAYSLTLTAAPQGPAGRLTIWPAGGALPGASMLNSPRGSTVANTVLVPAGAGGSIQVFAWEATDLVMDINGYFGK